MRVPTRQACGPTRAEAVSWRQWIRAVGETAGVEEDQAGRRRTCGTKRQPVEYGDDRRRAVG
jgi:hypothetical protein